MQKHVNLVDLAKSFPTNIFLNNLASMQKRMSLVKFENFINLAEKSEQGSISNLSTKVGRQVRAAGRQVAAKCRRSGRASGAARACRPDSRGIRRRGRARRSKEEPDSPKRSSNQKTVLLNSLRLCTTSFSRLHLLRTRCRAVSCCVCDPCTCA